MAPASLLVTSGQVRTLSLVSYLFSVWISYQAATVVTVDTFIWLNFHHVSSPLAVLITFLKRGAGVGVVACAIALLADVVLLLTSLIAVVRCLDSQQASNDCPVRLVQHSWIVLFAAQHVVIAALEVFSMIAYQNLLREEVEDFEKALARAEDASARKRMLKDARDKRYRVTAAIERRLSIFALSPGVFYWIFVGPTSYGILCTIAGMRVLRDAYGIWSSYRVQKNATLTQREFFDTVTTVLSAAFLCVSVSAFLWCEEFELLISDFSTELLFDAVKNAYDDPFSFMADSLDVAFTARPESFVLLFAYLECLVLANKNSTTRL